MPMQITKQAVSFIALQFSPPGRPCLGIRRMRRAATGNATPYMEMAEITICTVWFSKSTSRPPTRPTSIVITISTSWAAKATPIKANSTRPSRENWRDCSLERAVFSCSSIKILARVWASAIAQACCTCIWM